MPGCKPSWLAQVDQAGADGFVVAAKAKIEEGPGREVAAGQRAHRRPIGHVFLLGVPYGLVVRLQFRQDRHALGKHRGDVLHGDVDRMERIVALCHKRLHVMNILGNGKRFLQLPHFLTVLACPNLEP